jgi:AbrB family looped-hinge helix DNA binding protein
MKSTGIVRKLDDLGRVVIPMELRKTLQLTIGAPVEIFIDGESIVLRKYQPDKVWTEENLKDALVMICRETGKDPVNYLRKAKETSHG